MTEAPPSYQQSMAEAPCVITPQRLEQLRGIDRFGDVVVHAQIEASLARSSMVAWAVIAMMGKR